MQLSIFYLFIFSIFFIYLNLVSRSFLFFSAISSWVNIYLFQTICFFITGKSLLMTHSVHYYIIIYHYCKKWCSYEHYYHYNDFLCIVVHNIIIISKAIIIRMIKNAIITSIQSPSPLSHLFHRQHHPHYHKKHLSFSCSVNLYESEGSHKISFCLHRRK